MTLATNPSFHPNQSALAAELGLAVDDLNTVEELIVAIESKLGSEAEAESARWFSLSVLRHMRKAKWTEPNASGLDDAGQKALAKDCLALVGFATSLRTVTKDARSKFRLVGFASSKKIDRGVLATGTKAYKLASQVIVQAGLLEEKKQEKEKEKEKPAQEASASKQTKAPPVTIEIEKTVVGRRAKRRGYGEDETPKEGAAQASTEKTQTLSMSEEEFAKLEAALGKSDTEIVQQNWGDQENEDRLSRILGLIAGAGFFVFIAMLFL